MWRYLKAEQGLCLIELLVAIVLLVGTLVGFSFFLAKGQGMVGSLGSDRLATGISEKFIEQMTGLGYYNLALTNSPVYTVVLIDDRGTVDDADDLNGEYTYEVTLESSCAYSCVLTTMTLTYPAGQPNQKEVRLAKIIAP